MSIGLEEGNVFSKRNIFAVCIAQERFDLRASVTFDPGNLETAVVDQCPSDFPGLLVMVKEVAVQGVCRHSPHDDQAHRFLLAKMPVYAQDPRREEAGFVLEGNVCTLVDVKRSVGCETVE